MAGIGNNHETETRSVAGKPGVYIVTFGCQMNEYDTEKMFQVLAGSHRPVSAVEEADVVIVNTCSVREKGEHKLFSLLGELRDYKASTRPDLIIGVGGCVGQQEGKRILRRVPSVNFVVGTHNISLIPALIRESASGESRPVAIDYRDEWEELPGEVDSLPGFVTEGHSNGRGAAGLPVVRALVAIQRGCAKRCSFCVVPTTRGAEVSRDCAEVLREVRQKVRLGAREVLLLGQTVNSYGKDLSPRVPFEDLVRRVAEIEGVERIRFTSPHPQEVRPGFIELYKSVEKLCPHIHLPVQSGSDRILQLMNRNYRTARYLEIVAALRAVRPDIAITSDVIVGFPTESGDDFEQTLELMRKVRFVSTYSFCYSERPNTVAKVKFGAEDQVPGEESRRRLRELQALQDEISLADNAARIGGVEEVLVEGTSDHISSVVKGRNPQNVMVECAESSAAAGSTIRVLIEHAGSYCLRGRQVHGEEHQDGRTR